MSILSQFVKHNASWLAPAAAAVPFVGGAVSSQLRAIDASEKAGGAPVAAAPVAVQPVPMNMPPRPAPSPLGNQQTLLYVGIGIAVLLLLVFLFRRR